MMMKNCVEQIKSGKLKKYVKYMGNAVSALSILFVLSALAGIDVDVSEVTDWRMFLLFCLIGVCLKTITVFWSGSAWRRWLELFSGKECDRKEALRIYAKANIGKYMPGNVMHYVERNLFAGNLGLSQKQMAAASISEVLSLVFTAFFLCAVLAYSQMRIALRQIVTEWAFFENPVNILLLSCIGVGILCIVSAVLLAGCRKKMYPLRGFFRTFFRCFLTYAAVLSVLGFILVLAYWCWVGTPTCQQGVLMSAAYVIAWALGFVIPGAPGGIGVRELVLTLLLSPVAGKNNIVALGVVHRLITVLGDFTAYFIRTWYPLRHV